MIAKLYLNEHVLNKYALRTRFFVNCDQWGWGIKGGGQAGSGWPCAQFNRGSQIQTLKKKLRKLNANAQYTIVAMSQTNIQYSVTIGDILATLFFAELRCYTIVATAVLRAIRLAIRSLVLAGTWAVRRRRKTRSFPFWQLKAAFGCPGEFVWLTASGICRSSLCRRSLA